MRARESKLIMAKSKIPTGAKPVNASVICGGTLGRSLRTERIDFSTFVYGALFKNERCFNIAILTMIPHPEDFDKIAYSRLSFWGNLEYNIWFGEYGPETYQKYCDHCPRRPWENDAC